MPDTGGGVSDGAVAGITVVVVMGVVVAIAIIAVLIAVFCWKRRQYNAVLGSSTSEGEAINTSSRLTIQKLPESSLIHKPPKGSFKSIISSRF